VYRNSDELNNPGLTGKEGLAKASCNKRVKLFLFHPKPSDLTVSRLKLYQKWRIEPVSVEKDWDDLRFGVKG